MPPMPSMPSMPPSSAPQDASLASFLSSLGLTRFESVPVRHCPDAAAVVLAHAPSGWSLAYSGDCRPSRAFARAARGVDVLVHEATFADDRRADAEAKRHCTAAEARRVVAEAGARCGVLTHFSQRYPREQIPTLSDEQPRGGSGSGSGAGGGVVVAAGGGGSAGAGAAAGARVAVASAFDGMRVRWDGLDALDAIARRAGEMFAAREAERRGEAMEEG